MTTLITGAGPVGTSTARLLARGGENVVLLDQAPAESAIAALLGGMPVEIVRGDILDGDLLDRLIDSRGIDRVVHTAAMLTSAMRRDPRLGVRVNIEGTVNVMEAARRAALSRVVLATSTTIAYPTFERLSARPVPEDFPLHVISERPFTFYSATKLACEHMALLYAADFGLDVVILRYAAVLGLWHGPNNSIPGRLVRALLEPALNGKPSVLDDPLLVWKGGEEFVDVRDVAAANLAALSAEAPVARVYNIGSGALWSFDDFVAAARTVAPGLQLDVRVTATGAFAGGRVARLQPSDISAAKRELGFTPQQSLASAMAAAAAVLDGERGTIEAGRSRRAPEDA